MPTAADVPNRFDLVLNGQGYLFDSTFDPSVYFKSQKATFTYTPTFIERTNVSGSWGDDEQAFFLTQTQKDWSLGAGQKYFNDTSDATQSRQFWSCQRAEITKAGEISLGASAKQSNFVSAPACGIGGGMVQALKHIVGLSGAATLDYIDGAGTVTSAGGLTYANNVQWGVATDGTSIYGNNGVGGNAHGVVGAICFLNGLLYTTDGSVLDSWVGPSTGTTTILFTWKNANGSALTPQARHPKLIPHGGKVLIWWPQLTDRPELWQYDGTNTNLQAALPKSVIGHDIIDIQGLVYLSGLASATQGGVTGGRPTIWMWDGSSIAKIYESPYVVSTNAVNIAAMPALGTYQGDLVFTDPAQANGPYAAPMLMRYVSATGAIYPLDTYTVSSLTGVFTPFMSSTETSVLLGHKDASTGQVLYPFDYSGSAQLDTSLFTFNTSLTKTFRGVTVEWSGDTAPNVSYQIDSVEGSYTLLANGVASGAETTFPANTTGRGVSIRVVIPSGTTKITRIYVRAAPHLTQFRYATYILNLSGNKNNPAGLGSGASLLTLRDGSTHNKDGTDMANDLVTAVESTSPISITDRFGTFTGTIEPQNFELHEMKTGYGRAEYRAIVTVRQV